ncbi:hypothetical protein [Nocardioides fonticola]
MGTRTWMRVVLTGAVVSLTAAALGGTSPAEGADGPTVAQYACQGATGYAASVPVAVDYLAYEPNRSAIATVRVGLTTPMGPVPADAGTIEAWISNAFTGFTVDTYDPVAGGYIPNGSAAPSGSARTAIAIPKVVTSNGSLKAARFTPGADSVYCGVYARILNAANGSGPVDQIAGPTQP